MRTGPVPFSRPAGGGAEGALASGLGPWQASAQRLKHWLVERGATGLDRVVPQ